MQSTKRSREIALMGKLNNRRLFVYFFLCGAVKQKNSLGNVAINEQIYQFYSNIVAGRTNTISYAFTSVLLGMIRYEMVIKDDSAYRRYSLETPTQKICCSGKEKLSLTGQILPPCFIVVDVCVSHPG